MSRFKIAFENTNEDETVVVAADDGAIQDLEIADAELTANEADIGQAEDISEGLGKVEDLLETSVATGEDGVEGEGITPETAEAVEIATEHFAKRLNVQYRVLPSLEAFGDGGSRAATTTALKRVKSLQAAVESSLVVANEGVIEDIKTAYTMTQETSEKVLARAEAVSGKNFTEGTTFTNDSWAKYIPTPKASLTGADVVKIAEDAAAASNSDKVGELVKQFIQGVKKATLKVRGIWFWSNAGDISHIKDISEQINAVATELKQTNETASAGRHGEARSFTTPTKQEAKKISQAIEKLLGSSSIEPLVKELGSESVGLKLWSWLNSSIRLKSMLAALPVVGSAVGVAQTVNSVKTESTALDKLSAEDLTATKEAVVEARRALTSLRAVSVHRVKLASALISYLEKSAS